MNDKSEVNILKQNKQESRLFYNIQAIEICKKHNAKYTYSTSRDLKTDRIEVEDTPAVIEELRGLNCWVRITTSVRKDGMHVFVFETDINHL